MNEIMRGLTRDERSAEVLKLARQGYSMRAIAQQLAVSSQTVYADIHRALDKAAASRDEALEAYRVVQDERYSSLLTAYLPLALDVTNPQWDKAADRVLRIMDSLNRLHALYAAPDERKQDIPKSITINLSGDTTVSFNRDENAPVHAHADDDNVILVE